MTVASDKPPSFVSTDVNCRRCGYNLRNLSSDANCPECATPVSQSLHGDWIRVSDSHWVSRLTAGAWFLFLAGLCLAPALLASAWLARYLPRRSSWADILLIGTSLGGAYGGWLLSTSDPGGTDEQTHGLWRRVTRVLLVIAVVGRALHGLARWMVVSPDEYLALLLAGTAAGLATAALPFVLLRLVSGLARRVPDQCLSRRATLLSFACPIGLAGLLGLRAIQVSKSVLRLRRLHDRIVEWHGQGPFAVSPLRTIAGVVILGNVVLAGLFLAVLFRLIRDLRTSRSG
jgi:hypothetical protein